MTVLQNVGGWVLVALVGWLLWRALAAFENYAQEIYGHAFFLNSTALLALIVSAGLTFGGAYCYYAAVREHGDLLNGQVLIGAAGLVLVGLVIYNILRTTVTLGLTGSTLQITLFVVFLPFAVVALILYVIGKVALERGLPGPPFVLFWWR